MPSSSSLSSPPPPPPPPHTPSLRRPALLLDDSDSDDAALPIPKPIPFPPEAPPAHNFSRPGVARGDTEHVTHSQATGSAHLGHRPRQRSQGYFEPSLSSALPTSQSAAHAALAHQTAEHNRKRSTTIPAPGDNAQPISPPPLPGHMTFRTNGVTYTNVAFPRSPLHSPGMEGPQPQGSPPQLHKAKEGKSKMKLFSSKPKSIKVDRQYDGKTQTLPSPGKMAIGIHSSHALNRMMMNQSTTSLADSTPSSSTASIYSSANASTSTLVPPRSDSFLPPAQKEEKHKHHFLSRQKHKLKDKDEYSLPLSSANSNSRPTDPSAPQPLYSFAAPASPGHSSAFPSSMTGLDLRHGGRHLRRAKKEEKAAQYLDAQLDPPHRERNHSFSTERSERPSLATSISTTPHTTTPAQTMSHTTEMVSLGSSFGISGLSPDDAWPLLKARVLLIFEGEDPRPPVEDFNALVAVHIKRCVHKRSPILLIEDLDELLQTGFGSLDQTLRHVPDDRLIPHLVEMWLVVFTTILPFLQAVFLPLDLEFRGSGIMTSAQAAEFWGVMLPDEMNTKAPENNTKNIPILGELEVRRITLLMFRDIVILPRYDSLMNIFSRLSLENLNAGLESPSPIPDRPGTAGSATPHHDHPTTTTTTTTSTTWSSSSYLDSTTTATAPTAPTTITSSRSRATSNTSAGSFSSNPHPLHMHTHTHTTTPTPTPTPPSTIHLHLHAPPHQHHTTSSSLRNQPMDSAKVTETVGRMLQCVSVLVSLQSSDGAQEKMSRLTKELKYNWLGRGRTGRQRQGFVGPRSTRRGVNLAAAGGVGLSLSVVPGLGID